MIRHTVTELSLGDFGLEVRVATVELKPLANISIRRGRKLLRAHHRNPIGLGNPAGCQNH
jgi:hypothetical protein